MKKTSVENSFLKKHMMNALYILLMGFITKLINLPYFLLNIFATAAVVMGILKLGFLMFLSFLKKIKPSLYEKMVHWLDS